MQTVALQSPDSNGPVETTIVRQSGAHKVHGEAKTGENLLEFEMLDEHATHGSLLVHGRVVRYFVQRVDNTIRVWLNGRIHTLQLVERVARRATGARSSAVASNRINAPMPGTILKINIEPGAAFAAREALIVMESMKMEMTLTSPAPGRIELLHCKVGQLVDQGDLLATLELDGEST